MPTVSAPALDSQLPLPILTPTQDGGAVFMGWGLPALESRVSAAKSISPLASGFGSWHSGQRSRYD